MTTDSEITLDRAQHLHDRLYGQRHYPGNAAPPTRRALGPEHAALLAEFEALPLSERERVMVADWRREGWGRVDMVAKFHNGGDHRVGSIAWNNRPFYRLEIRRGTQYAYRVYMVPA